MGGNTYLANTEFVFNLHVAKMFFSVHFLYLVDENFLLGKQQTLSTD